MLGSALTAYAAIADREREGARWHPKYETLELAAASAARVLLGSDHSATQALSQAAITVARIDLWHARLAMKTLRLDQREAIAEVAEI